MSDQDITEDVELQILPDKDQEPPSPETPSEPLKVTYTQALRYAGTHEYALMGIGAVGAVVNGMSMPAFALLFGELLDSFADSDDVVASVRPVALAFAVVGIISFFAFLVQMTCWKLSALRQANRIRTEYFAAVLRKSVPWYDLNPDTVHSFASELSVDCQAIQDGLGEKSANIIQFSVMFLTGITIGLVKGWQLTLVVLALLPLIAGSSAFMAASLNKMARKSQLAYAKAGAIASEVLRYIRVVVSFQGESYEAERYEKEVSESAELEKRKGTLIGASLGVTHFSIFLSYGLALWYGAKLIRDNTYNSATQSEYEGGDVITIFFSVLIGSFAIGQMAPNLPHVFKALSSAAKVYSVIDAVADDEQLEQGKVLSELKGNVELCNVSFTYPTREGQVLKNVSLSVSSGETIAIVGSSGSGKSTVLGLLQGFYQPEQGSVCFDGHALTELSLGWIRDRMGVVLQTPCLFRGSIRDNICAGRENTTHEQVVAAATKANAHVFITRLEQGYDTEIGTGSLSGGQKQRIALARALLREPSLLLLDEATSALDTRSEREVQSVLEGLTGVTTVIVAHRLSTVRHADRIYVLERGEVAEVGSHTELMARNGVYRMLVEAQEVVEERSAEEQVGKEKSAEVTAERESEKEETESGEILDEEKKNAPHVPLTRAFRELDTKYLLIGGVAAVLNGMVFPSFAIILGGMLEVFYIEDEDRQSRLATEYMLFFFACGVGALLFGVVQHRAFAIAGNQLTLSLRSQAFRTLLQKAVSWHENIPNKFAVLSARLASDAEKVRAATSDKVSLVLQAGAMVIYGLLLSLIFAWALALSILAVAPFLVLVGVLQLKFMGTGSGTRDAMEGSAGLASEAAGEPRTVKALGMQKRLLDRFGNGVDTEEEVRRAFIAGIAAGSYNLILFSVYAFAFYIGALYVEEGLMDFDQVFKSFFALVFSFMTAGQLLELAPEAKDAQSSVNIIFQMIDEEPDSSSDGDDDKNAKDIPLGTSEISLEQVGFRYPSRPETQVLQGVDLRLCPGETVALVGQSGSGKSSIVALLQGFYKPESGKILVDGQDFESLSLQSLRKRMGLVTQEPVIFSRSLRENIAYGSFEVTDEEIWQALGSANLKEFVQQLPQGLDTMVGSSELSGGQKQRVTIARALLKNPELLLLDEATSALDNESEKLVQSALDKLMTDRTTLVIAHRLSTIRHADRILVLEQGTVVEQGTHEELMQLQGVYYNYVRISNDPQK